MAILKVADAAYMAGVSHVAMSRKIASGEINSSSDGIDVSELIRVYPDLKPLANLKIREVKKAPANKQASAAESDATESEHETAKLQTHASTVELLIRELEWNKELLEQTNQLMAKQLADQRALIADQARRLDDKDRFWARQIEIAQSLLPAPAPRKKFLGLF